MLNNIKTVFIVGIKGVGMANLALILKKMGKDVSGSDVEEEFITDKWLKKQKIIIFPGFSPFNIPKETQAVVYSAAHGGSENVQVLEAKKRGIRVFHQAEFISGLMEQFKTKVAVAGSHGKTTTASLLAYSLIKLGAKPTYLVGSSDFDGYPAGDFGSYDFFVVEADEYAVDPPKDKTPKFNFLNPDIILCTNIDFDHPDVFADVTEIEKAFSNFFKKGKKIIQCEKLNMKDIKTNEKGTSFVLDGHGQFEISLYGEKNAWNAAGVVTTLVELGFKKEKIRKAIKTFTGPKRRFEQKFVVNNTYLFDDYAHHPKEIEATINAARKKFSKKRVIVIFQSHTFSRTQALLKDFSKALSLADYAFILPIFSSARENPADFSVTHHDIEKSAGRNAKAVDSKASLLAELRKTLKRGDVIFTMGAGDVYKLDSDIIEVIRKV